MKSTNNNLLQLVYRLLASGIILFICSELFLAYVFAFHLIPSEKSLLYAKVHDSIRIGIEESHESYLFEDLEISREASLSKLEDTYEVCVSFKNDLIDVVKTDQITAQLLMEKYDARPYAFLFSEETREPLAERLVLITRSEAAEFFEQTEGLKIVLNSDLKDIDTIIFEEFLRQRTENIDKWFSQVYRTSSHYKALDMVVEKEADIAAVTEKTYKDYLKSKGKSVDSLRVLWYSNPVCKNIIMVHKSLMEDQLEQVKSILKQEEDIRMNWMLFDDSLEDLEKWKFTIRGKKYVHPGFSLAERGNL